MIFSTGGRPQRRARNNSFNSGSNGNLFGSSQHMAADDGRFDSPIPVKELPSSLGIGSPEVAELMDSWKRRGKRKLSLEDPDGNQMTFRFF